MDLVVRPNGVNGVLILHIQQHMIIHIEDLIHLTTPSISILHMETILNKWVVLEAAIALAGSKGHPPACRGHRQVRVVTTTMVEEAIIQMLHLLISPLHMLLALLPLQLTVHHKLSLVTTTVSSKVKVMGILLLILSQLLIRAMVMDMSRNTTIMLRCRIHTVDTGVLSKFTLRLVLNRFILDNSSMIISLNPMVSQPKDHHLSLMALLGLVSLEESLIKVALPQLHMHKICNLNKHINTQLVALLSNILPMALCKARTVTIRPPLPTLLPVTHSRVPRQVMVNQVYSNRLLMANK